ncbi:hypothetical protein Pelo_8756 [Pelomyxa schiedti]|nr:hypothetical protein Pelo_8756 [Pelomyxa schiedti]
MYTGDDERPFRAPPRPDAAPPTTSPSSPQTGTGTHEKRWSMGGYRSRGPQQQQLQQQPPSDTCTVESEELRLLKQELEAMKKKALEGERASLETRRKMLIAAGKNFKRKFCRFRSGEMALVDLYRLNLETAIYLGGGSNGYVSSVAVLPQVTNVVTITPQPVETGRRVALKMMINYSAGMHTKQQRAFYDREAQVGLIYPHWCFCNVFSTFRAETKLCLIQAKKNFVLINENLQCVDPSNCCNSETGIPVFNRTTYITMELGKYTLESAVALTFHRCGTTKPDTGVLPLSCDKLVELSFCLLCACNHLNSRGWFHCDIKLDNVLAMERSGVTGQFWALCDFGTSLFSPNGEFQFAHNESFEGNSMNRAPECYTPEQLPSGAHKYILKKNDVWAIGCVLYEAVCGQHPYYRVNQIDYTLLVPRTLGPFTVPSPQRESNPEVSALASYLLERDHTKRPYAKQAMLVSGALMFIPRESLLQFAVYQNKPALHSQIWAIHESNVSAMEACVATNTPPTVRQLSSLVFTNEALKDLELFTSCLLHFLEIFHSALRTRH